MKLEKMMTRVLVLPLLPPSPCKGFHGDDARHGDSNGGKHGAGESQRQVDMKIWCPVLSDYGKSYNSINLCAGCCAISFLAAQPGSGLDVGGDAVQDLHDDGDGDADEEHEHEAVEEEARDEVHDAQGDDAAHQLLAVDVLHVLRPVELLHRPPGLHCGSCVVALTRHRN